MTPAARAQAAIELLDEIIRAAQESGAAADTLIARYFKARRYAGAKDRRAVRELVFRAIRRAGDSPASGRAALIGLAAEEAELAACFDGSTHGPAPVGPDETPANAGIAPAWLLDRLDPVIDATERPVLLGRAPLDLRVNRLQATRSEIETVFPDAAPTPHSPIGLRLRDARVIEQEPIYRDGLVEVQDEGSQLLVLACEAKQNELVVDLCAGAGGKTLGLAAEMGDAGRIIAADTDRARLGRMALRLTRAGVTIVESRLLNPGAELDALADVVGRADLVLVDAPCSGTGTWRRNPEARWRLTPARLERLVALQARLMDVAAELVRPGGRLVYAVCSLLGEEGRGQAAAFEARHSSFVREEGAMNAGRAAGPGRLLTPGHDDTDGFFVARWNRP